MLSYGWLTFLADNKDNDLIAKTVSNSLPPIKSSSFLLSQNQLKELEIYEEEEDATMYVNQTIILFTLFCTSLTNRWNA